MNEVNKFVMKRQALLLMHKNKVQYKLLVSLRNCISKVQAYQFVWESVFEKNGYNKFIFPNSFLLLKQFLLVVPGIFVFLQDL